MKRQVFLLLAILAMLPIGAQIRGNSIVVTVEPDHQVWKRSRNSSQKIANNEESNSNRCSGISSSNGRMHK